jgi:hypothetical protein
MKKRRITVYCKFAGIPHYSTILSYVKYAPAADCTVKCEAWEYANGGVSIICYGYATD